VISWLVELIKCVWGWFRTTNEGAPYLARFVSDVATREIRGSGVERSAVSDALLMRVPVRTHSIKPTLFLSITTRLLTHNFHQQNPGIRDAGDKREDESQHQPIHAGVFSRE
jgi:hypothetical protein